MKNQFTAIFVLFISCHICAQDRQIDSLRRLLGTTNNDTSAFRIVKLISWNTLFSYSDTALVYARNALLLSKKLASPGEESEALLLCGYANTVIGDYSAAINYLLKGLHIEQELKTPRTNFYIPIPMLQLFYYVLSEAYQEYGDYNKAIFYLDIGKQFHRQNEDDNLMEALSRRSQIFDRFNKPDSAIIYGKKANELDIKLNGRSERCPTLIAIGNAYFKTGNYPFALEYYRLGQQTGDFKYAYKDVVDVYNGMAKTFAAINKTDSCLYYAQRSLSLQNVISYPKGALNTYSILTEIYKKQERPDSALHYLEKINSLHENLFSQQKEREVQNISFNEQLRQQEIQQEQKDYRNKIRMYVLLGSTAILIITAFLLYRNNRHRKKAYVLLQKQKKETDEQKLKTEQTLAELKATQAQLIQSEKMASLGELTAGIAHEIQNPLNFVNNFSEVNTELTNELEQEANKGNMEEVKAIARDIRNNEQKINEHGKRADSIVKGMLQHSRSSSWQKELTDINALCDEYVRLAFHGLRAKDKSFNARIETNFELSIGKINLVPQEIGRVILNLINNAFYAVGERRRVEGEGYEPTVTVSTKRSLSSGEGRGEVLITVTDNGNGIPRAIIDKIFQPFFTTKPTGQGTGLGLSLAYDIVKAHGGAIKVETRENEGTEFTMVLAV